MRNSCSHEQTCGLVHRISKYGMEQVFETQEREINKCAAGKPMGINKAFCALANRNVFIDRVN